MNEHIPHNSGGFDAEPARADLLIGRIVDGEAFEDDWNEFEAMSRSEPSMLVALARAQREHAQLEHDVADAVATCELIEVPDSALHGVSMAARFRQYSGWAVAAIVSLALLTVLGVQMPGGSHSGNQAGLIPASMNSEQALNEYMRTGMAEGRVVGEMPTVLMNVQQVPSSREMQVVYLRQIVERARLTDLSVLNVERDEFGNPRYVSTPVHRVASRSTGLRY